VLLLVAPWTHFDETIDGIVYAAAAGAGFALVENIAFMRDQPDVILARGPAATAAHVLFAMFWGGAVGFAGHQRGWFRRSATVLGGLLAAILAHGTFNALAFSAGREITLQQGRLAQIALLLVCLACLRPGIRFALRLRPFRFRAGQRAVPPA
jgi:RsiW-degrading membrane proteinase PrsW (M82 family)